MYNLGRKEIFGPRIEFSEEEWQRIVRAGMSNTEEVIPAIMDNDEEIVIFGQWADHSEMADKLDLIELNRNHETATFSSVSNSLEVPVAETFRKLGWEPGWYYVIFDDEVPFIAVKYSSDMKWFMRERYEGSLQGNPLSLHSNTTEEPRVVDEARLEPETL